MTFLSSFRLDPRSFGATAAAIALAASAAACGSTAKDVPFLGPVDTDAGQPEASTDSAIPPVPMTLTVTPCASGALVGADEASVLRSVSVLGNRAIIVSEGSISAWNTAAEGCPADRVTTFGQDGEVAIAATSAAAVPGGRALAATSDGLLLLSSTGETATSCRLNDNEVVTRTVAMSADGNGIAAFVRSPLYSIGTDLAWPDLCAVGTVSLSPEPFAIAAATRFGDQWVTVEQASASSALVVAWYAQDGSQLATSGAWSANEQPGHLCSASAILAKGTRVLVADAVCGALVVFDSQSHDPIARATLTGTPRGLALTSNGDALVGITSLIKDGAIATFGVVTLP